MPRQTAVDFQRSLRRVEPLILIFDGLDTWGQQSVVNECIRKISNDHSKPFVSHVCIQNWDVKRTPEWRDAYRKPVIDDEPEYEGNIYPAWGNLSAQELVHRFWIAVMRGGYAGHGETYSHPEDIIWWAKGGRLYGESWKRIGFLREIIEADVRGGLTPMGGSGAWPWSRVSGAMDGDLRYIYFGEHQPLQWTTGLATDTRRYQVDIIDTWNMTVTSTRQIPALIPHSDTPRRRGPRRQGGRGVRRRAARATLSRPPLQAGLE
jgi:hypothetical protein